jgi:hypothetical protein
MDRIDLGVSIGANSPQGDGSFLFPFPFSFINHAQDIINVARFDANCQ